MLGRASQGSAVTGFNWGALETGDHPFNPKAGLDQKTKAQGVVARNTWFPGIPNGFSFNGSFPGVALAKPNRALGGVPWAPLGFPGCLLLFFSWGAGFGKKQGGLLTSQTLRMENKEANQGLLGQGPLVPDQRGGPSFLDEREFQGQRDKQKLGLVRGPNGHIGKFPPGGSFKILCMARKGLAPVLNFLGNPWGGKIFFPNTKKGTLGIFSPPPFGEKRRVPGKYIKRGSFSPRKFSGDTTFPQNFGGGLLGVPNKVTTFGLAREIDPGLAQKICSRPL